jgi:hypothetical protein
MKKSLAMIAMWAVALGVGRAVPSVGPVAPATFTLKAISTALPFEQTGGKTNLTATSTNITRMYKSTITNSVFDNKAMLALLENSFNTNFPPGSQVAMNFNHLVVVDSTGTNVIFLPGSVVTMQFDFGTDMTIEKVISNLTSSGTQVSGSYVNTATISATLSYDDSANTTADNTHTKFAFKGLQVLQTNLNLKTNVEKITATFQGTGGGPVRGVKTILTGTIGFKLTAVPSPP